jgi:hypothetical protein
MMQPDFARERRTEPRERIEFPLKVIAFTDERFPKEGYAAMAVDVSEEGICLQASQTLPIHTSIKCIVNLEEKEAPECFIGKLMWGFKNENTFRYGVRFDRERNSSIKAFLNKIRTCPARPETRIQPVEPDISDKAILQVARYIGVSEIELKRIQLLDKQYVHKTDPNQVVVSTIYNADEYGYEVEELRPHVLFYAYACPNLTCPVVFDHPLDHYPMMSLFEIGRQMSLAIMHQFYQVPFEGYMCISNEVGFNYKVFAELDMPLALITADTSELQIGEKIQRRNLHIFYIQENCICATAKVDMTSCKKDVYKKIRKSARRSRLANKFGNIEDVKFISNLDAVSLFASRENVS